MFTLLSHELVSSETGCFFFFSPEPTLYNLNKAQGAPKGCLAISWRQTFSAVCRSHQKLSMLGLECSTIFNPDLSICTESLLFIELHFSNKRNSLFTNLYLLSASEVARSSKDNILCKKIVE